MYVCPKCGLTKAICPPSAMCWGCGTKMKVATLKRGRTDAQKRSQDQERRGAKRYGMHKQPASGSRDGAKSDLRAANKRRAELKETIKKSFSLKLETLKKLEMEATGSEDPLLEIEFQGTFPHKRYVVLPDWAYESMIQRLEAADGDNDNT